MISTLGISPFIVYQQNQQIKMTTLGKDIIYGTTKIN